MSFLHLFLFLYFFIWFDDLHLCVVSLVLQCAICVSGMPFILSFKDLFHEVFNLVTFTFCEIMRVYSTCQEFGQA